LGSKIDAPYAFCIQSGVSKIITAIV
jgi:hypothetical protein